MAPTMVPDGEQDPEVRADQSLGMGIKHASLSWPSGMLSL